MADARRGGTGPEHRDARGRLLLAAPCRLLGLSVPSRRGCQDSRFPAARGAGRFQPQPIFGESLSRLRHPAPGGGGGGPKSGPSHRGVAALRKGTGAQASRRQASGSVVSGHAGPGETATAQPPLAPLRWPPRAAWEAGAERAAARLCHFSCPLLC